MTTLNVGERFSTILAILFDFMPVLRRLLRAPDHTSVWVSMFVYQIFRNC